MASRETGDRVAAGRERRVRDLPPPTAAGAPPPAAGWRTRVVSRSLEKATKRSLERSRAFLDAANALLRDAGADGFTIQEVADRAGLSLRTFYQHFSSKDDLLLALFEEDVLLHVATIRRKVEEHTDPLLRLTTLIVAGLHVPPANVGHSILIGKYRLGLAASHPEELAVVYAPSVALARELVTEAMEAGAIPAGDPEEAAYMILSLRSSHTLSTLLGNEFGTRMPSPEALARFCVRGLGGTPTEDLPSVPIRAKAR